MSTQTTTMPVEINTDWPTDLDPDAHAAALERAKSDPAYLDALLPTYAIHGWGWSEEEVDQAAQTGWEDSDYFYGAEGRDEILKRLEAGVTNRRKLSPLLAALARADIPVETGTAESPFCLIQFPCPLCGKEVVLIDSEGRKPGPLGTALLAHTDIHMDVDRAHDAQVLEALGFAVGLEPGQELDWDMAFAEDHEEEPDWLIPGVMARGELVTFFGASGGRKSLLAVFYAFQTVKAGEHVLYLDRENRRGEVVRRLRKMGATPDQLQLLHYRWLPDWLVDDPSGQESILKAAQGMALVVFDSWARFFTSGNQSDDGPANAAYNGVLLPLRGRNVGVLRLDHSGHKDTSRPSGTVVKQADADHLWMVNTKGERTTLTHTKNRTGRTGPDVLVLDWREGPLRAEAPAGTVATAQEDQEAAKEVDPVTACVAALDGLSIDPAWGRERVGKALQAAGYRGKAGWGNETVSKAIAARRSGGQG
ncbi:AAA family ATPase [Micromonospora zamorensis]|uniref:AAA family ATPase n=1 Tax=Micromonospora zamorensis TaxID=709883 RepID=UPI0033D6887C